MEPILNDDNLLAKKERQNILCRDEWRCLVLFRR